MQSSQQSNQDASQQQTNGDYDGNIEGLQNLQVSDNNNANSNINELAQQQQQQQQQHDLSDDLNLSTSSSMQHQLTPFDTSTISSAFGSPIQYSFNPQATLASNGQQQAPMSQTYQQQMGQYSYNQMMNNQNSNQQSSFGPMSHSSHHHHQQQHHHSTIYHPHPTPHQHPLYDPNNKLFIGQIPRHIVESDLRKLFAPFGEICELVVLRDKHTNLHRGCAFLTYALRSSADQAIAQLHEQISLHNRPLVVRYAGSSHAPHETKLFVGMLGKTTDETRLHEIFSSFGTVTEIFLMRDAQRNSKCSAFVKLSRRQEAEYAINQLHDTFQDINATRKIVVKLADSKSQRNSISSSSSSIGASTSSLSTPFQSSSTNAPMLNTSQTSSSTSSNNMSLQQELFAQQQAMLGMNAATPWLMQQAQQQSSSVPQSARSRLSSLQAMNQQPQPSQQSSSTAATPNSSAVTAASFYQPYYDFAAYQQWMQNAAAQQALQSSNTSTDAVTTNLMNDQLAVLNAAVTAQQSPSLSVATTSPLFAQSTTNASQLTMTPELSQPSLSLYSNSSALLGGVPNANLLSASSTASSNAAPPVQQQQQHQSMSHHPPSIRGPPGSNLFIYSLPSSFTDADLWQLFSSFGQLISTRVFRDRQTGQSRGFGFASYTLAEDASRAIQALNGATVGGRQLKVQLKSNLPAGSNHDNLNNNNSFNSNYNLNHSIHHINSSTHNNTTSSIASSSNDQESEPTTSKKQLIPDSTSTASTSTKSSAKAPVGAVAALAAKSEAQTQGEVGETQTIESDSSTAATKGSSSINSSKASTDNEPKDGKSLKIDVAAATGEQSPIVDSKPVERESNDKSQIASQTDSSKEPVSPSFNRFQA